MADIAQIHNEAGTHALAPRHCERSEAIQLSRQPMDCVVAPLLAMTEVSMVEAPIPHEAMTHARAGHLVSAACNWPNEAAADMVFGECGR